MLPVWAWIAIGVGVALLVAATAIAGIFGVRAIRRRALLRLVVRAEAVEATEKALEDSLRRLAEADDTALEVFADDPEAAERRMLAEVANRARLLTDELDRIAVPSSLTDVADALADAAHLIAEQAEMITDDDTGPTAFDKLARMDLKLTRAYANKARLRVMNACDVCGLQETAVYGGGLYL